VTINIKDIAAQGNLPKELSNEIFQRVSETSVIAKVAGKTDMTIQGNKFLIDSGKVEADIVEEGKPKPVSSFGLSYVEATPLKAAVIVDWTKEARLANPGGIMDRINDKLVEAINEQIDAAVLYGKSVKSKSQIPNLAYLNQATNRVELGTAAANAGGLSSDILAGYDLVTDAGKDFTGFIADPRFRSQLIGAVDVNGRPVYQSSVNLNDQMGSLFGLPVSYGKTVSGRYGIDNPDTNVRAFGGDFQNNLKFGFVEDINIKMTDSATVGGVSMFETNKEAALVEAIFGFVINDLDSFVAYETAAPAGGE